MSILFPQLSDLFIILFYFFQNKAPNNSEEIQTKHACNSSLARVFRLWDDNCPSSVWRLKPDIDSREK